MLKQFFPFLRWFPMRRDTLRADLVAGITVAMILVPQSMAYASLDRKSTRLNSSHQ